MENYKVLLYGKYYNLPQYSIQIASRIEETSNLVRECKLIRTSLEEMYKFIVDVLGKENAVEVMGKFDDADPNTINITFLSIADAYNRPFYDYNKEKQEKALDTEAVELIRTMFGNADKFAELLNKAQAK